MSKLLPVPYRGEQPYIFVSYAHRDREMVLPILSRLYADGYRVWFDEGIDPDPERDEEIALHVEQCGYFLALISAQYLASDNCKDELNYARNLQKNRLLIYLEEVSLPGGMAMRMNRLQSIYRCRYRSEEGFFSVLYSTKGLSAFCRTAPTAHGGSTGLSFFEEESGLVVDGLGDCADCDIIIPATHEGIAVRHIGVNAFRGQKHITSVTIPEGITEIHTSAFQGCEGLSAVHLPRSLTRIGRCAFADTAFLRAEENRTNGVLYAGHCLIEAARELCGEYAILPGTTVIAEQAFEGCAALSAVTVPDGVTALAAWVFQGCTALRTVRLSDTVQEIGAAAFEGCAALTDITLPAGLARIGGSAFDGCTSLAELRLPRTVEEISPTAFQRCQDLTTITVERGNARFASIGNCLIRLADGCLVVGCQGSRIPEDGCVTRIGSRAFSGQTILSDLALPDAVTEIEDYAFVGCTGLCSISLSAHLTRIGHSAFLGCSALSLLVVPDEVTELASWCLCTCTALRELTLPACLARIGDNALRGCSALTTIRFRGTRAAWRAISKGRDWDLYTGAYTIECIDGVDR